MTGLRRRKADQADLEAREGLIAAMRQLDARGLNHGSAGNGSVRASDGGFWITPTGLSAAELNLDNLVWIDERGVAHGDWQPSSEWHFHRAVLAGRHDLHAVLHAHAPHATALACLRRPLPAFHYMVAVAGGDDVPCTPYHLFGTEALSDAVAAAFRERLACLMAHHGLVAGGRDMGHALRVMLEVESLSGIYLQALSVGEPPVLSADEMAQVLEKFRTYGQPQAAPDRRRS